MSLEVKWPLIQLEAHRELSIHDDPPVALAYDDLALACVEKAKEAGRLDEHNAAVETYRKWIWNRGALPVLALARAGVDVAALETLFLLREQEQKERVERTVYAPFSPLQASVVQEASEWAFRGYPSPAPVVIEAMRTAGVSARDFADNLLTVALTKKTP
jgi:hypothetical protein